MKIADDDIAAISARWGYEFDEDHRHVLKATHNCDVNAVPGGGKTTMLVAKLEILARKWECRDQGILVLSHTNVARDEVAQRLGRDPHGSRLLRYPHCIDTIQTFVHRFLALPYLRDAKGDAWTEFVRIDDEHFERRAKELFYGEWGRRRFAKAHSYLRRRSDAAKVISTLRFVNLKEIASDAKLPNSETPSYRDLFAFKARLASDGFFRYADMFAFADLRLAMFPKLIDALRTRFLWVFVDEMQDTEEHQDALLGRIFASGVVLQRFGDRNQGIYHSGASAVAPFLGVSGLDISRSHRFGSQIARFASRLITETTGDIRGSGRRKDRRHTIFLFEPASVRLVLPAFGELILAEWPAARAGGLVVKAVGARKRTAGIPPADKVPYSVQDYWCELQTEPDRVGLARERFAHAARWARHVVAADGELQEGYHILLQATAEAWSAQAASRVSVRELRTLLRQSEAATRRLNDLLCGVLFGERLSEETWAKFVVAFSALLEETTGNPLTGECADFLGWMPGQAAGVVSPKDLNPLTNRFVHRSDRGEVHVDVGTIHSVKGETHDATLLLETMNRSHDLEDLVPVLAGVEERSVLRAKKTLQEHAKRAFVAMTRPRELVCLAINRQHVSQECLAGLTAAGWFIENIG